MRKIRDGIEVKHFLPTGEVIVSFELSYDDWCLLRQSDNWNHIQNWIEELQSKGNQMSLKKKISLLEKEGVKQMSQHVRTKNLNKELAWFCTGHWLKCLYDDFLHKRLAGEQMPCELCERRNECSTCPPISFMPLMKKSGVKIKTIFNVEENTHYPS